MRVAVFGIGYVGAVSAACLAEDGHPVTAVDTNPTKVECVRDGMSPIVEPGLDDLIKSGVASGRLRATTDTAEAISCSELSLICVGTPSRSNGELDLSAVRRVCEQIGGALSATTEFHAIVIRSTMLPGSTTGVAVPILEARSGKRAGVEFGVAVCPEFLREGTALRDYREAPTFVAGALDERTLSLLKELTDGLGTQLLPTEPATAEMLKYANNAWHAVKVVFANEIGSVSKALGVDGRNVMEILCADTRLNISPTYLRPGFAFGGSCLPKDLRALLYKSRQLDVSCPMLEATPHSNEQHIRRAVEMVCAAGNWRVGMIGLSFKGGTDDLRESPAMDLAERLFGKGYDIRIFDRNVSLAKLTGANLSFIESRNPQLATLLRDDVHEVVRHGKTIILAHHNATGNAVLPGLRSDQFIIDRTAYPSRTTSLVGIIAVYVGKKQPPNRRSLMPARPRHLIERATERLIQSGAFDRSTANLLDEDLVGPHPEADRASSARYFALGTRLSPSSQTFPWFREVAPVLARLLVASTERSGAVVAYTTAVDSGDGASTVARQLAYAAGRLTWCRTLLLDAHPGTNDQSASLGARLPNLLQGFVSGRPAEVAIVDVANAVFHAAALPGIFSPETMLAMNELRSHLDSAYNLVIVDCPPILKEPYLPPVSLRSPKIVLVLRAGRTRLSLSLRAKQEIEGLGADLFGAVLTDYKRHIPRLFDAALQ